MKEFNLYNFIKGQLRRVFRRTPIYYNTLKDAKVYIKHGRISYWYMCNMCLCLFPQKEVQVDHTTPVEPVDGSGNDYNSLVSRMFESEVQVLCKSCHKLKTKEENVIRRTNKKKRKE